jgi:SNF2 family DNA or RNA helicase
MAYITPYIKITHMHNQCNNDIIVGKLKDDINIEKLDYIMQLLKKNQEFVDFVNASNYNFIPLQNYYNEEVAEVFDIYGGEYNETIDNIIYTIQIYFYKIKNVELLTSEVINKFELIFRYDYFVKNNILDMKWHNYRFNKYFNDKLNKKLFLDLNYAKPAYCNTELFSHQKNNLSQMFHIHNNPTSIQMSDNMPIHFENELIYDIVKEEFISKTDIPTYHITSGMILDEPGTGKTLQFILYLLEMKLKALVLVPNNSIKMVWMEEFEKHIKSSVIIPFDIMTFNEIEEMRNVDETFLNQYQIIGIDEIHNLYNRPKGNIFHKIITSSIKYRWGITGTPFVSDTSFFQIIKFLTGYKFNNERIANSPLIQEQFIKLFLKNCKTDMTEYQWPELNIHDVYVKLDIVQQNMYDAEKMLNRNNDILRRLVCEINLMFSEGEFNTPSELKQYGIKHYQNLYEKEKTKLDELKHQFENIKANIDKFEEKELERRIAHYKELIRNQTEKTHKYQHVSNFFMSAIDNINNVINNQKDRNDDMVIDNTEEDEDSRCPICWDMYDMPISYIKSCGHYFCKKCLDQIRNSISNANCPKCRNTFDGSDIINVQQVNDINNSSKIHELLNIINNNNNKKYIIFTQFDKVIDKIKQYLTRNNISAETYNDYNGEQILLLSSQQNAEGINLSMFDKMIIFEPFEDNVYCNQVEKQLIARIHRIGRTKLVDVYRFITKGTIEEEIYKK